MTGSEKAERVALNVLGGASAPESISNDLAAVAELSPSARATLWRALGPSLDEPVTPAAEQALEAFAKEHALEQQLLGRAIRALRFLVREGVRRGLDANAVAADAGALAGADGAAKAIVLAGYERARGYLTARAAARAVRAHDDTLASVDWRLDRVVAAPEADRIEADVAVLALEIDRADGSRSTVRFRADLERVEALLTACQAVLGAARRASPRS
ncbi:MAG: hypothetical protein U0271_00635 [Polyangiaceae bacterium]